MSRSLERRLARLENAADARHARDTGPDLSNDALLERIKAMRQAAQRGDQEAARRFEKITGIMEKADARRNRAGNS